MLFDKIEIKKTKINEFLDNTKKEFDSATLPIPLGLDKNGKYHLGDLQNLGHILIAGSTGSGKSVFNHAAIYTLAQKYPPEELRFFLADTKYVEMLIYQDIKYLFSKIETEPEKIYLSLENLVEEKNKRLQGNKKTPYLVVIIDTFSILAYTDISRFEDLVQGITKDGPKAGIHMIMCDSRPSKDAFTDKIMDCFPTKIAFNTASDEDSEVILGQIGAEWLLGAGDMYLLKSGQKEPTRLQSPFVPENDLHKLISCINKIN